MVHFFIFETPNVKTKKIVILDGVLYIEGTSKMHAQLLQKSSKYDIMSAMLLREFLYSL